MSKHRESISRIQKDIDNEKLTLKSVLKSIEDDKNNDNEAENYGLIYECGNRICGFIRSKRELQRLIMMKSETYIKHSEALAKKEA